MQRSGGILLTQTLLGEHGAIHHLFNRIERTVPTLASLGEVRLVNELLGYVLHSHAELEDDLLFAALDAPLGGMGPLEMLRHEHDEIDQLLDKMRASVDVETARRVTERKTVADAVARIRRHLEKEEQVIYPLAAVILDEETDLRLGGRWAERRGVATRARQSA